MNDTTNPVMESALEEVVALRAENHRLTRCLNEANSSAEHFERLWYLECDRAETLRAQLTEAQRDADRYRYLRAHSTFFDPSQNDTGFLRQPPCRIWYHETPYIGADTLDVAIDAAKGESNA